MTLNSKAIIEYGCSKVIVGQRYNGSTPLQVVAIGASAGGLQAIKNILSALPPDFPAAIIILQHASPNHKSLLAEILNHMTSLFVKEAEDNDQLAGGTVYVAPPGKHILISPYGAVSFSNSPKVHFVRPSLDVLFHSLAISLGDCVIGVVLTGGDGDGAEGIRAIKSRGGTTIAQNEESSEFPSMPRAAARTGDVDYVLPLSLIAPKLASICARTIASVEPE
ncbi:hypothetical protein CCAX7_36050 [Capsulimonas corticalis]|uniref:protein-glutamate methylesterase n=1 Tax=Capsulimonas corticalis TaxID=2219043 RepID=A0A402D764_9BACT|nr:chemotaxis protein CheB [Capsulimonas corticalis]BDI31554.1 hypothetical protein CCAX7_36050 [Capsulimonas corticalis]